MGRKLSKIYTLNNTFCLILFLSLICAYFCGNAEETSSITSSALMPAKVIDGDSIEIGSHRIRLMGIDAPEYSQKCKNKNKQTYPCGKKSVQYLQKLVNSNNVTCHIIKKDQYDRDLCTCYADGKNINQEMILSGNAIVYLESPYKKEQDIAKQHKRGLWQGRFMQPRLFRRLKEQEKAN
jgi:endonuclease YncB( thermonuclease family)